MSKDIIDAAKWRHAVKAYSNSGRKLSDEQVNGLKSLLRLAPSSVNLQPWHFIIASSEAGKERIAKTAYGAYEYNSHSIRRASHVIVFAAKTNVTQADVDNLVEREDQDGRFVIEGAKEQRRHTISYNAEKQRDSGNMETWLGNQGYIALGWALLGAASLGIDATPMEGFDKDMLDEELGLKERGMRSLCLLTLGFLDEDEDYNNNLPKSRLPESEIIEEI